MNARQKAKKYKQEIKNLKMNLAHEHLYRQNAEMAACRLALRNTELDKIRTESEEFCCSCILSPEEYKTVDRDELKGILARELTEVIKDRLHLKIDPDNDYKPNYFKAYARIRIFNR